MNLVARISKGSVQTLSDLEQAISNNDSDSQGQRKTGRPSAGPSRIGVGVTFVGRLESNGEIQVEGAFEGELRGYAVKLGGEARVKGNIIGEIAQLAGVVEGNIEAQNVIITKNARVSGDIRYRSLQIEEGAHIDGNCRPLPQAPSN